MTPRLWPRGCTRRPREASRDATSRRDSILGLFDLAGNVFNFVADGSPVASSRDIARPTFCNNAYDRAAKYCIYQQIQAASGCIVSCKVLLDVLISVKDPKDQRRGRIFTTSASRTTSAGLMTAVP